MASRDANCLLDDNPYTASPPILNIAKEQDYNAPGSIGIPTSATRKLRCDTRKMRDRARKEWARKKEEKPRLGNEAFRPFRNAREWQCGEARNESAKRRVLLIQRPWASPSLSEPKLVASPTVCELQRCWRTKSSGNCQSMRKLPKPRNYPRIQSAYWHSRQPAARRALAIRRSKLFLKAHLFVDAQGLMRRLRSDWLRRVRR